MSWADFFYISVGAAAWSVVIASGMVVYGVIKAMQGVRTMAVEIREKGEEIKRLRTRVAISALEWLESLFRGKRKGGE